MADIEKIEKKENALKEKMEKYQALLNALEEKKDRETMKQIKMTVRKLNLSLKDVPEVLALMAQEKEGNEI